MISIRPLIVSLQKRVVVLVQGKVKRIIPVDLVTARKFYSLIRGLIIARTIAQAFLNSRRTSSISKFTTTIRLLVTPTTNLMKVLTIITTTHSTMYRLVKPTLSNSSLSLRPIIFTRSSTLSRGQIIIIHTKQLGKTRGSRNLNS